MLRPPLPHHILAGLLLCVLLAPAAAQEGDEAWFRAEVWPVLDARCGKCHGPDARRVKGGLRFSDRAALLAGGSSGPAVTPGDPDASLLIRAVRREDEDLAMPPKEPLPEAEVATLVEWVRRGAPWSQPAVDPKAALLFEEEIRPLLVERCFGCHGPELDEVEGGFRMAGRAGLLAGGNHGPALVPGEPEQSRLILAVQYEDRHLKMPPDGKLSTKEVTRLAQWVALGAPWPSYEGPALTQGAGGTDIEAGRQWWSFRPVVRPALPAVSDPDRVARPLDAFVVARLEAAGLAPSPPATDRELVRRLYLDVLGLPPTYEQVEAYRADARPDRWERLVDEVLARPEYGERLGRRWLDVVRFAQTNGYERDREKPSAWRYRDWVIDAFNEDLPYDRFLTEQLAGDELEDADREALVATSLYRLGSWDDEPDDKAEAEFDELDDLVRVISEGMLGVTLGCARCHDHKFDPFPQEDYYSLVAFLRSVRRYETPQYSLDSAVLKPLEATPENIEDWERGRQLRIAEVEQTQRRLLGDAMRDYIEPRISGLPEEVRLAFLTPEDERTNRQKGLLRRHPGIQPSLRELSKSMTYQVRQELIFLTEEQKVLAASFEGDLDWALSVSESGAEPVSTQLLVRGRAGTPGADVSPRFVRVLCSSDADAVPGIVEPPPTAQTTGLRSALAAWVTSPTNPLTARVIANRVWAGLFGGGIVPTPNDFGRTGMAPTHPELLDWLASDLVTRGWSLKSLHREILLSSTYRSSSHAPNPAALAADPGNDLLWRKDLRRLEAEGVRDSLLFVSGELESTAGGRGFFPRLSREALAGMSRPGRGWGVSAPAERSRRSVYAYVKRGIQLPLLQVFDLAEPQMPVGQRSTTTTAAQALILLNNDFVNEQAAALARRARSEAGEDPAAQVRRVYQLAFARLPGEWEVAHCDEFLRAQIDAFTDIVEPLVLRPAVPLRLDVGFEALLAPEDMLYGPRDGWRYLRGDWGNPYNGTIEMDPTRGPAALYPGAQHEDATLSARLRTRPGCAQAGLVLRAVEDGDHLTGIEVRLEPQRGTIAIVHHGAESSELLVEMEAGVGPERWHHVLAMLADGVLRVGLDGSEVLALDVSAIDLPAAGGVGLRVLGEAVELADVVLRTVEGSVSLAADTPPEPALRALEALCLALLNTNEFVYVD